MSLSCRVIIEYLCERFIFQRQLAYCVLRWRLPLILIVIYFRFLEFWNGSSTLYIQICIFIFISCWYMYTPLYYIMYCNSLFFLHLLYMMCTVYDIMFGLILLYICNIKIGLKYTYRFHTGIIFWFQTFHTKL